ncbi:endophilin-B1-like isoform X2 [Montipora foliosa]|uniref:endophilin-B1-like isoform X2 n=1 Tax=Montipora foliosa TaxID=591990 RepID=UPI0035F17B14
MRRKGPIGCPLRSCFNMDYFRSVNVNNMADSMKKFGAQTATFFSRAKQYTEEQLGTSEKTVFDARFESLVEKADRTKYWTERLLRQTEALLQRNPGLRAEEFVYQKLDKPKPPRVTESEALGQSMIEAGNDFGPGTNYGSALVKCGEAEKKLGQAERDLKAKSMSHFLHHLKNFLEGDMKTITKERRTLSAKRLDLDACKTKVRKAQSPEKIQQVTFKCLTKGLFLPDDKAAKMYSSRNMVVITELDKAEADLRASQAEFDRQYEVTKLLLDGISTAHANHHRALMNFVEAQAQYYAQCHAYMQDLQKQLASPPGDAGLSMAPPSAPPSSDTSSRFDLNTVPRPSLTKKAKVLYDYDAVEKNELSLLADEVITVYSAPGLDSDWMIGERGSQRGKVPLTYLELL